MGFEERGIKSEYLKLELYRKLCIIKHENDSFHMKYFETTCFSHLLPSFAILWILFDFLKEMAIDKCKCCRHMILHEMINGKVQYFGNG